MWPLKTGFTVSFLLIGNTYNPSYGPLRKKTCLRGSTNNTGADQPAFTRSLISAFVIRSLESSISKRASSEITIFQLVSVAGETGLSLVFNGNPEDRFSRDEAQYYS